MKILLCISSLLFNCSLSFLIVCLIKPAPCVLYRHLLGIFAPLRTLYFDIIGITRAFSRASHVLSYLDYLVFISVTPACLQLFFSPWPNFRRIGYFCGRKIAKKRQNFLIVVGTVSTLHSHSSTRKGVAKTLYPGKKIFKNSLHTVSLHSLSISSLCRGFACIS